MVSRARALQFLAYDEATGDLLWVKKPNSRCKDIAGSVDRRRGYRTIKIDYERYYAHQLVFLIHHGWIPDLIDHINRDTSDNRIENLRAVTRTANALNAGPKKSNTSGATGVSEVGSKWRARIKIARREHYLGLFATKQEAVDAYERAARTMGGV